MKHIRVITKNVYGNTLFYPLDYKKQLEVLTGQKTLTKPKILALKELGFSFTVEVEEVFDITKM